MGGILLAAGLLKIPNLNDFYQSVARYDFFSVLFGNFLPFVVRLFVLFEIIIGLLLITGHLRRTVLGAASVLIIIFIGLSTYDYIIGSVHSCGCFGGIEILESSSEWRIIQNAILLAILIITTKYNVYKPFNKRKTFLFIILTSITIILLSLINLVNDEDRYELLTTKDEYQLRNIIERQLIKKDHLLFQDIHGYYYGFDDLIQSYQVNLILLYNPVRCFQCLSEIHELISKLNIYFNIEVNFVAISLNNTNLIEFPSLLALHTFNIDSSYIINNDSYFQETLTTPLLITLYDKSIISVKSLSSDKYKQMETFYNIIYELAQCK